MGTPSHDPSPAGSNGEQASFLPPFSADSGAPSKDGLDARPEILVGAAFAGGLLLAKILGRARGG